jgi:1,4-dihydroxy-2-naphthoate octaprenyltransferase
MGGDMRRLGPLRLPFLPLTPLCVLAGAGAAFWTTGRADTFLAALCLLGALCAHISVNAFNEYGDFKSGLDALTRRTPFSGGSGTLPAHPELAGWILAVAATTLAVAALIGLYFVFMRGIGLLPLGLLGLAAILAYTPWLTRRPLLCLFAPGLGFGPLMVMGTQFVLTGAYAAAAFAASLPIFFLVNNLLLLNQFPDIEADRQVGRRHLPIVLGRRRAAWIFCLFLLLAFVSLSAAVVAGHLPNACLLGLAALPLALPLAWGVLRHAENAEALMPYLGLNVALNLLVPLLLALGLFLG